VTFKDLQTLWDGEMLNDEVVKSSMALMQASRVAQRRIRGMLPTGALKQRFCLQARDLACPLALAMPLLSAISSVASSTQNYVMSPSWGEAL
jgi:hypothetical protein